MNLLNKQLLTQDIKSNKWIPILTSAFLAIILVLITVNTANYDEFIYETVNAFMVPLIITFPFVVLLTALKTFSFLHGKSKLDFYHGLPIKRETLFYTKYLSGLILSFTPFIVFGTISLIAFNSIPKIESTDFTLLPAIYLRTIILCFVGYSFVVFCGVISGKLFSHLFLLVSSVFIPAVLFFCTYYFMTISINRGIDIENILENFFSFVFIDYMFKNTPIFPIFSSMVLIIAGIIFTILSCNIYKVFKSENTEKFITNRVFFIFYKYLTIVSIAIFTTTIHISIGSVYYKDTDYYSTCFLAFIMFLIVEFFIYLVVCAIFDGGFNKKIFNVKSFATLLLIAIVYNSFALLDPFNYKEFAPSPNEIASVTIDSITYTDSTGFEDIIEFQKFLIENENNYNYTNFSVNQHYIIVTYNYTNGKKLNRRYMIDLNEDVLGEFENFYTSEYYKNTIISGLEEYKLSFDNNLASDNDDRFYDNNWQNIRFNNFMYNYNTANKNDIIECIDNLILDIKNDEDFGGYSYQSIPYMSMELSASKSTIFTPYGYFDLPIKHTYTNTLKTIEKKSKPINDNFDYKIVTFKNSNLPNEKNIYNPNTIYATSSDVEYFDRILDSEFTYEVETIDYKTEYDDFMNFFETQEAFYFNPTYGYEKEDLYNAYVITYSDDVIQSYYELGKFRK